MTSPSSNSPALGTSSIQFLAATIPYITLFIALLMIAHHITIKLSQTKSLPPGPPGLPFLSNLSLILRPNLHHRLGTKLWIVISSPTIAKQIFIEKDLEFSNHEQPIAATVISYDGSNLVRCPYGPTWRMLRKVFVHELVNAKSLDAAAELRQGDALKAKQNLFSRPVLTEQMECYM